MPTAPIKTSGTLGLPKKPPEPAGAHVFIPVDGRYVLYERCVNGTPGGWRKVPLWTSEDARTVLGINT